MNNTNKKQFFVTAALLLSTMWVGSTQGMEGEKAEVKIPGLAAYEDPENYEFRKWFYENIDTGVKELVFINEFAELVEDIAEALPPILRSPTFSTKRKHVVNMQNSKGETPLIRIAQIFKRVNEAAPDTKSLPGSLPYITLLAMLISSGADEHIKDNTGKTYAEYLDKKVRDAWSEAKGKWIQTPID